MKPGVTHRKRGQLHWQRFRTDQEEEGIASAAVYLPLVSTNAELRAQFTTFKAMELKRLTPLFSKPEMDFQI